MFGSQSLKSIVADPFLQVLDEYEGFFRDDVRASEEQAEDRAREIDKSNAKDFQALDGKLAVAKETFAAKVPRLIAGISRIFL